MTREKAEIENNLIARGMKLKVKEEELDQSKKEAEMYKNRIVQLAKEKFKLEEEFRKMRKEKSELGVGMKKETEKPETELRESEDEKRNLKKENLFFKVLFVCIEFMSVGAFCHTFSSQFGMCVHVWTEVLPACVDGGSGQRYYLYMCGQWYYLYMCGWRYYLYMCGMEVLYLYMCGWRYYLYMCGRRYTTVPVHVWTVVLPVHVWMEVLPVHVWTEVLPVHVWIEVLPVHVWTEVLPVHTIHKHTCTCSVYSQYNV